MKVTVVLSAPDSCSPQIVVATLTTEFDLTSGRLSLANLE